MRFISPISAYKIVAIHQETEIKGDGRRAVTKPGYMVEFKQGDLTDYERQVARERLKFRSQTLYKDGTPVDMITRASSFDTAVIEDADLRKRVEQAMLNNADHGKQDGYILVEAPKVPAPWASYDELTIHGRRTAQAVAAKNLEIAATTGTPIDALIAYEKQNRNDERIVASYEAALEAPAEPAEELVEA